MFIPPEVFKFAHQMLPKLFGILKSIRTQRDEKIECISEVFGNPFELADYYIEPDCQQFNPADYDSEDTTIVREPLISHLQKFIDGDVRSNGNHKFILADAGMGKTSCLVLLKLAHIHSFWPKDYKCELFKLGPDTLQQIEECSTNKTVLLLDALDEDPLAWGRTEARLLEILIATRNFYRVIITCRTQFFSGGKDPFDRRGQVSIEGFTCPTIYLSLFSLEQVYAYLQKRFPDDETNQEKAYELLKKTHSLKFRPMILSHIDAFLESKSTFHDEFTLYEVLVDVWLQRERQKRLITTPPNKVPSVKEMHIACQYLAKVMFELNTRTLNIENIRNILAFNSIPSIISDMDLGGRSLLNKNSDDEFRFSHYSVQEFMFCQAIINKLIKVASPASYKATGLTLLFLNQYILQGNKVENLDLYFLDFTGNKYSNVIFKELPFNFSKSNMSLCTFQNCNFSSARLIGTSLKCSHFVNAKVNEALFDGAILEETTFTGSHICKMDLSTTNHNKISFSSSNIEDLVLSKASSKRFTIKKSKTKQANVTDYTFHGPVFEDTLFNKSNLTHSTFNESKLKKVTFKDCKFEGCSFRYMAAQNITLKNCIVDKCTFSNCELRNIKLYNCKVSNVTFSQSKWNHVVLRSGNFSHNEFIECFLRREEIENILKISKTNIITKIKNTEAITEMDSKVGMIPSSKFD